MRAFWVGVAVLLGGMLMFMAGAAFAVEYSAFDWASGWAKRSDDYRFGYAAGAADTVLFMQAVGVSGATLNNAVACVKNTKGLTNGTITRTVDAQLANNPKFPDTVAAAVIATLDSCKLTAPAAGPSNQTNTIRLKP